MLNYDFVPINKRRPLKFPNGKRVALIISFNLETWDMTKDTEEPYYAGGPAVLPNILPGNVADFPNYTWRNMDNGSAFSGCLMHLINLMLNRLARPTL